MDRASSTMTPAQTGARSRERSFQLRLAGAFELGMDGCLIRVPPSAQRVLAYLALARRPVSRSQCAGVLWEFGTQDHANSSLRTALWRLNRCCGSLLVRESDCLSLVPELRVDTDDLADLCAGLVHCGALADGTTLAPILAEPILLPMWSDPWVIAERECLRMLRIQALESAATDLADEQPAAALVAAMAVIRTEPLQESSWRLVVAVNLRQGNVATAHRAYRTYRRMLAAELGAEPSELMEALVRGGGSVTSRA